MSPELISLISNGALGAVFAWLYWDERKQRIAMQIKHEQDMQRVQDQRVQDLKLIAHLPTDLVADYTMPPKAA